MHEARTFSEGTPCHVHQFHLPCRLARCAVATWVREHDLLAEHVHGFRGGASPDGRLLGGLLPRRDWLGRWRLIGGDSRSRCFRNRGRRRTGGLVLGRVDEDDEQKPDSQPDADHPFAGGHIGRTVALSVGRLRCGGCSRGFLGPSGRRFWRRWVARLRGDFRRRFAGKTGVSDIGDECRKTGEACGTSLLFVVSSSHGSSSPSHSRSLV